MKNLSLILFSLIFIFAMACNNEAKESTDGADTTAAKFFNSDEEMVADAKAQIEEISVTKLKEMLDAEEAMLLIDVRMAEEFKTGYIMGSVNIPRGVLEFRINKESFWEEEMLYVPKKDDQIIILCKLGQRGSLATLTLKSMGFTNVKNLDGGFKAFSEAYPDAVEKPVVVEGSDAVVESSSNSGGC